MTISSHPAPVPLFPSLESGTVEHTLDQRNSSWNTIGTSSLKTLANKVLVLNKLGNEPGTAPSKSVPPMPQSAIACGTSAEVGRKVERGTFLYEYEERLAIAEYAGEQSPDQVRRIAYLDAFVAILVTLPYENVEDDWMEHRIKEAHKWILAQGIEQPE